MTLPTNDVFAERKHLTFEQAEGIEPLPSQLQLKEISTELRSLLWKVVYESLMKDIDYSSMNGQGSLRGEWESILYDKHVIRDHLMADEFTYNLNRHIDKLKQIFEKGDYATIFGFLQFVLRHRERPLRFAEQINSALVYCRSAYRVIDYLTIVPNASETEGEILERVFADLAATEFHGARAHLREACMQLTAGKDADCIRESIHAVESVARILAPSGNFKDALAKLETSTKIHPALKSGFVSIYGYTCDEKGLRHPLLEKAEARIDETDALFMIGACASFVSYMINKAKLNGSLR